MRVFQAYISIILCLLCFSVASAQPDTARRSVDTPREALEVALAYTGFNEIQSLLKTEDYAGVEVITLKDSTIPFLVDQVYNRPVWKISVEDVRLDGPNWLRETVESQTPKNFTVILDSTKGFFVKAYSVYEGYDPQLAPEPPAAHAEKQLRFKAFTGFCALIPPITLFDALGRAAGSDPLGAKEIVAYLVKYKGYDATWQVIGRGIAPLYPLLFGPPPDPETDPMLYMVNRGRTVIDAESAALLEISNQPHPEVRPEQR